MVKQKEEFEAFGGPILLTTNCLVPPRDSYKERLYTTGAVGYPGCRHIEAGEDGKKDFSQIINQAKAMSAAGGTGNRQYCRRIRP